MICKYCGQETDRKLEVREMFVNLLSRGERKPVKVVGVEFGSEFKDHPYLENHRENIPAVVWVDVEA